LTYVIGEPCVDVMDRACVDECPVDCIYEGARSLYIQPDECVDCGASSPCARSRRSTTRRTCRTA
jgi:NAD-dependent dihydropyrimidine dehydrogenase PreA subunit